MTRAEIRRAAHTILIKVEWLNTHATTRIPRERRVLDFCLRDIEKMALKIVDAPIRAGAVQAKCDRSPSSLETPTTLPAPTSLPGSAESPSRAPLPSAQAV